MITCKSIRIIDYENQNITEVNTPEAFDDYVAELINHILDNKSVRDYKTRSNSTEVISSILQIHSHQEDNNFVDSQMNIIANRLLLKETEAQDLITRTNTTVQKGSLIQAMIYNETENIYTYLLAKVEHSEWVDDTDFSFRTGFSKNKKSLWKSCLFDISNPTEEVFYAKVYSNTRAQYWSDGFLEIEEVNSDEINSEKAFRAIDTVLNKNFKEIVCSDHTLIRNSFAVYLKSHDYIDYPVMVEDILGNYIPFDDRITSDKIIAIKERLLEQPNKRKFDSQFNVVKSVIDRRIKRIYPVYDGIDLKVYSEIRDLSDIIISIEENGIRYIKIRTNNMETYEKFKHS